MKYLLISLAFFSLIIISCKKDPQNLENSPIYPSPPSGDYKLIWQDDFNGKTLDLKKWGYRANGLRRQGWNSPSSIIIDTVGHNLIIRNIMRNDTAFTGMIGTHDRLEQKYGFFECRAKVPPITKGYWPAFWMQSQTFGKTLNPFESGMEIDIMEYVDGDPNVINHALHWNGYGSNLKSTSWSTSSTTFSDGNFHTYALEWTPKFYKFYVDGHLVWEVNDPISGANQYLILSCEISDKKAFNAKFSNQSADFIIDYVKVYEWTGK